MMRVSVRHNSRREEEPETAPHSLLMISMPESGTWIIQLKAAPEAVLIYHAATLILKLNLLSHPVIVY